MPRPLSALRLIGAYLRANMQAALEYRASFASEVFAMLVNDAMWLVFWIAFYERYPIIDGWQRAQVVTIWAVAATAYGLATAVFGNVQHLAGILVRGELDFFLGLPRPVLLHTLISRMSLSALGDVLFGMLAYGWLVQPSAGDWLLFAALVGSNAGILVGFMVSVNCCGFWLSNAEGLALQATHMLLSFSMYPSTIFHGGVKLALFSVLPAAFLGFVPVEVLRTHRVDWLAADMAVSLSFVALGSWLFARGLRRYESGSLWTARV